jgi:hypothetical protein
MLHIYSALIITFTLTLVTGSYIWISSNTIFTAIVVLVLFTSSGCGISGHGVTCMSVPVLLST